MHAFSVKTCFDPQAPKETGAQVHVDAMPNLFESMLLHVELDFSSSRASLVPPRADVAVRLRTACFRHVPSSLAWASSTFEIGTIERGLKLHVCVRFLFIFKHWYRDIWNWRLGFTSAEVQVLFWKQFVSFKILMSSGKSRCGGWWHLADQAGGKALHQSECTEET